MIISITPPKRISYTHILLKTKKYYNLSKYRTVVVGKSKDYYIFLRKRNLQLQIINNDPKTLTEIQKYLEYIFRNTYIGIPEKFYDILNLQGVEKVKM